MAKIDAKLRFCARFWLFFFFFFFPDIGMGPLRMSHFCFFLEMSLFFDAFCAKNKDARFVFNFPTVSSQFFLNKIQKNDDAIVSFCDLFSSFFAPFFLNYIYFLLFTTD
jgi:hypothetical protein